MKRIQKLNEKGLVSIIITMIMMIIITLIVLGFSEVTRRNQRESIDTQLGTQAYYAAETGVNDITSVINTGVTPISHNNCTSFNFGGKILPRQLTTSDTSVANTCLMMDPTPPSLIVDAISSSAESVVWDVNEASGNAFTQLLFNWQPDVGGTGTCSTAFKTYPTTANWSCDRALLRVDIVRADIGSTDAATLAANTATLYLQPTNGTQQNVTLNDFNSNNTGKVTAYQGACNVNSPTGCSVTVTLGAAAQTPRYYVRMSALYHDAKDVALTGFTSFGPARFKDGQILVDSTGRAQDQLKRIQVRIPLTKSSTTQPIGAVQSAGSTCKDILIPGTDYQTGACTMWPQ